MNPSCPPPVPSPPSASPTPDAAAQLTALGVRRQRRASASAGTVVPASLPEFRRYRPRAGHPDWPRLAAEAEALARALEPRLARPAGGLASLRRRAASLRTGAQNYLENRRRTRAGRHDLLPLYFIWTTLRPCNFRCTYCDDHQGGRYPELDGLHLDYIRHPDLLPFIPGVGLIIAKTGAPVLPLVIEGAPYAATAWGSLFKPSRTRVRVMPLISYPKEGMKPEQIARDLERRYAEWTGWPVAAPENG